MAEQTCKCEHPYIGTQMAGEPTRCERCRGLVDAAAQHRLNVLHKDSAARLSVRQPSEETSFERDVDTASACTCSQAPKVCPFHGERPTAHDTYAQHCKEHVLGTPAHGGARCPLCDLNDRANSSDVSLVTSDTSTDELAGPTEPSMTVPSIETLRGIVRMAALTVMDDVGDFDETAGKALATAIAAKASMNLREYLTSLTEGKP